MKLLNLIFIALGILLSANTCKNENTDNCHTFIRFENQTDKTLYVLTTSEKNYAGSPNYLHDLGFGKIMPKSSFNLRPSRDCLEYRFTGPLAVNELWIFPADLETLKNHDWKEVLEKRLFLKEYKLTLEDLRRMDWHIIFSEKDIKK